MVHITRLHLIEQERDKHWSQVGMQSHQQPTLAIAVAAIERMALQIINMHCQHIALDTTDRATCFVICQTLQHIIVPLESCKLSLGEIMLALVGPENLRAQGRSPWLLQFKRWPECAAHKLFKPFCVFPGLAAARLDELRGQGRSARAKTERQI